MSRFKGWSMKDVTKLELKQQGEKLNLKPKAKARKNKIDYPGIISNALTCLKIDHVREYKFLEDRRFKFDLAIPKHKIAIEFEGGIYTNSRHVRGVGYANDAKKYNLAVRHGWKLLRYTTADTKEPNWEFRAAEEIKELLEDGIVNNKNS